MGYLLEYDDAEGICSKEIIDRDKFDDFKSNSRIPVPRTSDDFPLLRTLNEAISLAIDEVNLQNEVAQVAEGVVNPTNAGTSNQTNASAPTNNPTTQGGNQPGSASSFTGNTFCMAFILFSFAISSMLSS